MAKAILPKVIDDADRLFCDRYTGSNGGMKATKLSLYPFMKEIKDRLFASVLLDQASQSPRLTIFSGHDTVIAPVLAVLGVYREEGMCIWPPYASRIIFELYVPASAPIPLPGYPLEEARTSVMVRVLFNGMK